MTSDDLSGSLKLELFILCGESKIVAKSLRSPKLEEAALQKVSLGNKN